jgi:hypothetical protein
MLQTRAHVVDEFWRDGVGIYLVDTENGNRRVAEPVDFVWSPVAEAVEVAVQAPTLRMPEHVARALLDALAAHFGGTSEVQTLRKDYMAERARVDKMIDHLTGPPPTPSVVDLRERGQ